MGLASHLSWWRLALVCLVSLTVIVVALIVVHDLWELAPDERVRSQVALFNAAMVAPVVVGVLVLYVALFTTMLLGSALLLSPGVVGQEIGHDAHLVDYLAIAWFVASLTTIAAALGAAPESDEEVQEAAYSVAPSEAAADEQKRRRRHHAAL